MTTGGVLPVFEDFKPQSEWQQDAQSHNLIISLPGFTKEQLRVSTEPSNSIRVRGERLVAGNKWSRFMEDYQVSENIDMRSIRARFQRGVLTITMAKKSADKPHDQALTSTDQPAPPKEAQREKPGGAADVQSDRTAVSPSRDGGRVAPPDSERKEVILSKEKQIGATSKELSQVKKVEDGVEEKRKESEAKSKRGRQLSGADEGASTMERCKKAMKGLNEERKLMVNMGAAVLVIMALSSYVTYKFVAGEDTK